MRVCVVCSKTKRSRVSIVYRDIKKFKRNTHETKNSKTAKPYNITLKFAKSQCCVMLLYFTRKTLQYNSEIRNVAMLCNAIIFYNKTPQ